MNWTRELVNCVDTFFSVRSQMGGIGSGVSHHHHLVRDLLHTVSESDKSNPTFSVKCLAWAATSDVRHFQSR